MSSTPNFDAHRQALTSAIAAGVCTGSSGPTVVSPSLRDTPPNVPDGIDVDTAIARFGDRTNQFVCESLHADWACFYRIGADSEPYAFRTFGVPSELRRAYLDQRVTDFEAMLPSRLSSRQRGFVTLADLGPERTTSRQMLHDSLAGFGARGAAEMLFRSRGIPIAGLSLVWLDARRADVKRKTAETLVSYIEFSLECIMQLAAPPDRNNAAAIADLGVLTRRERDIVNAVCAGLTNRDVAARLGIGQPTVKTHLINIFAKIGVHSRAELVSRMIGVGR